MSFNTVFVLVFLCYLSNPIDGLWTKPKLKGYNYVMGTEYSYKLYKTQKELQEIKAICEGEGASLFYPETEGEADAVMTFWHKREKDAFPTVFLIGLERSSDGEKQFKTVDGKAVSNVYTNWYTGEPNNAGDTENCVEMVYLANGTLLMNDVPCTSKAAFICKAPMNSNEWNKQCYMPIIDYAFAEQVGKCYKLHLNPKPWLEAREACRNENSDLAVINSRQELDYLVRLTDSIPKSRIPGTFMHGTVLLGFHRLVSEVWETVDGTTLYDSGYACWGNSQPDGDDRQRCGSMYYNGHLNDIECDQKSFFICEHNIDTRYYAYEPPPHIPTKESLHCYDDI